jgi:hypothetical protein
MGNPTFNEGDYLCIAPFTWARSKTARGAYRAVLSNLPGAPYVPDKKTAIARIWRLSDAVDLVEVDDLGGASMKPGEGKNGDDMEARLIWRDVCGIKPVQVPEHSLRAVNPETGEAI